MRQILLESPRNIRSLSVSIPEIEPGWVLAKTLRTGICGTDVHSFFGETIFGKVFPFHIGHEICAVVEESGGKNLRKGDFIAVNPFFTCGVCEACQMGAENNCENRTTIGLRGPGGFSEYICLPEPSAVKINGDDFAAMSLTEPLATVIYGFEKLRIDPTKSVLINGVGPIGLMFLQLVFQTNARRIAVADLNSEKLKKARGIGVDFALNPSDESDSVRFSAMCKEGFDVIIDCTGSIQAMKACLDSTAFGGQVLLFGICPADATIEISPFALYKKDVSVFTSFALNRASFRKAAALLESKRIDAGVLIDAVLPLSELEGAIRKISSGGANGKIIIDTTL